jgi:GntR family transcriptional regulator/MocR family aminotransferase
LGLIDLRVALAEYLSRARGVMAEPEQIVITSGFHHGLGVMARALKASGAEAVAVEAFGLDIYRAVLDDECLAIPPLGVDEDGAQVDELDPMSDAPAAVLLTPAHQFPTGHALSATRRAKVVEWARRTGGVVLEDDYDGEFRYDRRPIGALQGLAPDNVVYFGTASKAIAPALRLGWMAVPPRLMQVVAEAKGRVETVSVLDQLVLTEFITSGAFDRHVRGRRLNYRKRRSELVEAVAATDAEVRVVGMAAGLQAVLTLPAGTEAWVLQAAARQGLAVGGLAEFRHPALAREWPAGDAIVVNFASVSDSAWPGALRALCSVLP